MDANERISQDVHVLACEDCPRLSTATARGWTAYRIDEDAEDDGRALVFYCPDCSRSRREH